MIRTYGLSARGRASAIALAAAALAIGGVLLAFGIVLLLAVATVGMVVGAGVVLFRRLTGRTPGWIRAARFDPQLDPTLEVFPEPPAAQPPAQRLTSSEADT